MKQSPSWEANKFSDSQEIPRILWNPKVHYRIHKYPPTVPILSQLDPVHALSTFHFLKFQVIIILPSLPGSSLQLTRHLPACNATSQHGGPQRAPFSSQCHLIFLSALLCTLPTSYCHIEDSIRLYFSIANAGHFHRKTWRLCQIGEGVIETLTHDLVVWAISPTPWPLPDNTQHWQVETDFHAPRCNSNPQSHQSTDRLLPVRLIRTSVISLLYESASVNCR
jgi:hypothetical protein